MAQGYLRRHWPLAFAVVAIARCGSVDPPGQQALYPVPYALPLQTRTVPQGQTPDTQPQCPVQVLTFVPTTPGGVACGACGRQCGASEGCVEGACVPPSAGTPRLVTPSSLGRVTSQQPTLHWVLPGDADGGRVQVCRDRACTDVVQTADVLGSSVRPTAALRPGVYFWRVFAQQGGVTTARVSATWEFLVRARGAATDTTLGRITDFNGDGYADVLLSLDPNGSAGVYTGGHAGLTLTPASRIPPATSTSGAQRQVSTAGDLDGDGFADMVVLTLPGGDPSSRQAVWYPGGPAGLASTGVTLTSADPWPDTLVSAGDLDGDGYADLLGIDRERDGAPARARVWFGAPSTGLDPHAHDLLTADPGDGLAPVSTLADANGDGHPDLFFGAPSRDGGAGRALLWENSRAAAPSRLLAMDGEGSPPGHLGDAVAAWGDFDGDGYSDATVTAPYGRDVTDMGRVLVYPGGPTGIGAVPPRALPFTGSQQENIRPVVAGDLNADGYDDLVVWMHNDGRGPSMHIFYGSATGMPSTPARVAWPADFGETTETALSVGFAGDTDRDGYDDLLVYLSPGQVLLARGSASGLTVAPAPLLTAP